MIDPATSRMRNRKVNTDSESFQCALRYMTRLERDDLSDPAKLAALAGEAKISPEAFRERFEKVLH